MCPRFASVIQPDYAPKRWVVLGPFPNRTVETPSPFGATREGYDRDYLTSLGGEEVACLTSKSTVPVPGGPPAEVVTLTHPPHGVIDFRSAFAGDTDGRTAYAYGEIVSDRDQVLHIHFGSDDSAKVWLNGRLVHGVWTPGVGEPAAGTGGPSLGSDSFDAPVKKGRNRVLVTLRGE